MKRFVKSVVAIAFSVCAVVVFYKAYTSSLEKKIDALYEKYENAYSCSTAEEKFKGNVWIEHAGKNGNFFLLGSSELGAQVPQNPKYMFPNTNYPKQICMLGTGHVQNYHHAMNLGANAKSFEGNNIVIVQSIQWFYDEDTSVDGYMSHFSELQFWEFLHNPKISKKNKQYLASRFWQRENSYRLKGQKRNVSESDGKSTLYRLKNIARWFLRNKILCFMTEEPKHQQTYLLAKMYSSNNPIAKIGYVCFYPYYFCKFKILHARDLQQTYQVLLRSTETTKPDIVRNINWEEEYKNAEQQGMVACTNNDIYVNDEYYDTYLKEKWLELRDYIKEIDLQTSNEWEDYQFFCDVCHELGFNPYIIIMSVNGWYYDYVGHPKDVRADYYKRQIDVASQNNFKYLDLSPFEYQPYFYTDVMHLGRKGWLYVSESIAKNFNK